MRTSQVFYSLSLTVCIIIDLSACSKKKLDPTCDGYTITYDNYMKALISGSCMGGSCHNAGSGNGDLTTYAKVQVYVNNGKFKSEVLTNQSMPEGSSLSQEEINKVQCWADAGYPEK